MIQSLFFRAAMAGLLSLSVSAWAQEDSPSWQYGVRPGDTLIALGQRYLLEPKRWSEVQSFNHIADPRRIPPGTVLRIPVGLLRSTPGQASLKAVHGGVRWREGTNAWQNAAPGQMLGVGIELQTDEQGSAVLELANGTRLLLHPGSVLTLDTISLYGQGLMADTRLRLQQGQTEITDNPNQRPQQNLRILTPSAQAVVRGTTFRVGVAPDLTREETLEGAVAVAAAGQTVVVQGSQGTVARVGQAPSAPRALLPAPQLAALPRRLEQLPLRFAVPAAPGVVSLWGQIANDNSFDAILAEKTTTSGVLNFSDLPNGDYVLRVRATDDLGLQGLEARHAFTVFARPFAPTLQSPGKSATLRAPRPALSWTTAVGAQRYRLQVADAQDFATALHDQNLESTAWTPSADLPAGALWWRVASITAAGEQGPWSAPFDFIYKPGPGQPDLGQAALRFEADALILELPAPPADQHYGVSVSSTQQQADAAAQQSSSDGKLRFARPSAGEHFLGVRLIDNQDGTSGPVVLQKITVPARYPYLWIMVVPLLLAL